MKMTTCAHCGRASYPTTDCLDEATEPYRRGLDVVREWLTDPVKRAAISDDFMLDAIENLLATGTLNEVAGSVTRREQERDPGEDDESEDAERDEDRAAPVHRLLLLPPELVDLVP